jgi:acyl carrier protein
MPDSNEIRAKLVKVLVEALGVDENEIIPSATLQGDLGAESIDFLDIVFRLEKEYGIKIPRGELFFEPVFQGKAGFVQDGHLTAEGLTTLRSHMPYANLSNLGSDRRPINIADLFTVDLLASYIRWKLGHVGETESDAQPPTPASSSPIHQ